MTPRSSLIFVVTLSALAAAQTALPTCAVPCINSAIASNTTCVATDLVCQCQPANLQAIEQGSGACVVKNCDNPIAVLDDAKADCSSVLSSASASITSPAAASGSSTPTATASVFAADQTITNPAAPTDQSSDPTFGSAPTTTSYGSSLPTNASSISCSSALNNRTATRTSHIPQVSADAGVRMGFDVAGSVLGVITAVLVAL